MPHYNASRRRPTASLTDYAWALGLGPVLIAGEVAFRCPRCQRDINVAHVAPWPSQAWLAMVARLGEGPGCVAHGDTYRCGRCAHRGTRWYLRRLALEDANAYERLASAVAA